jgi:hypothetical protein
VATDGSLGRATSLTGPNLPVTSVTGGGGGPLNPGGFPPALRLRIPDPSNFKE